MPLVSAKDVAARLGVNAQRVRALAAQGRLPGSKVANRWLFDSELLHDHQIRGRSGGRPFSQPHALGLLYVASGEDASWLSEYDKWRLRRYLPRLAKLVPLLRARSQSALLRAPDSLVRRLLRDPRVVRSGVSAASDYGADISARGVVEFYCVGAYAEQLAHRYALRAVPEASANLILHRVKWQEPLSRRSVMPVGVVACDLADAADSRTRRAGRSLLQQLGGR